MLGRMRLLIASSAIVFFVLWSLLVLAAAAGDGNHGELQDGVTSSLLSWPTPTPSAATKGSSLRLSVTVKDTVNSPHPFSASALLCSAFAPNSVSDFVLHLKYPSQEHFIAPPADPQLPADQRQQLLFGQPQHSPSVNGTLVIAYTITRAEPVRPELVTLVCSRVAELLQVSNVALLDAGCESVYGSMLVDEEETDVHELTSLWLGWQPASAAPRLQQCNVRSSQHCKRVVHQHITLPAISWHGRQPSSLFQSTVAAGPHDSCEDAVSWLTLLVCLSAQYGQQQQLQELRVSNLERRSMLLVLAANESVQLVETATARSQSPSLTYSTSSSSLVQSTTATSSASSSSSSSSTSSSSPSTQSGPPSRPLLSMSRNLTGQGFHLSLTHSVQPASLSSLPCQPDHLHLIYVLPATFYFDLHVQANGYRLQPHNTVRLLAYSDIDVELPADKSYQHIAIVSAQRNQLLQPSFSVPLHLRYQPPALNRQYGDAALPLPLSAWIQCEHNNESDSGGEWLNVRVQWESTAVLEARVPVGSVEDEPMVYASAAGCGLIGTVVMAVALWMYPGRREGQTEHAE